MRTINLNIWGLDMLIMVCKSSPTGDPTGRRADIKQIRRFNRLLDELESIEEANKDYFKQFEKTPITIDQQLNDDVPIIELCLEDEDFKFLKDIHSNFTGYPIKQRKLVSIIDDAIESAEQYKINVAEFKEKQN